MNKMYNLPTIGIRAKCQSIFVIFLLQLLISCGGSSGSDSVAETSTAGDTIGNETTTGESTSNGSNGNGSNGDGSTDNNSTEGDSNEPSEGQMEADPNPDTVENNDAAFSDDNYSYTDFQGTEPNADGSYLTVGVSSITGLTGSYYNFLAGVYSYTAPPEIQQLLPDECIVLNGYAGILQSLTARSSRTPVNAGDAVVSSSAGTLATVPYELEFYNYYVNGFTDNPPENVLVNFTGNDIPALEVAIPNVEPLQLSFNIDDAPISHDTQYRWVAGSNPAAYINISGTVSDSPALSFSCQVVDDGEFMLSDAVVSRLGGEFVAIRGYLWRVQTELSVINNIAVRASGISTINYTQ